MSRYLGLFVGIVCVLGASQVGYKLYARDPLTIIDVWFVIAMTVLYGAQRILDFFPDKSASSAGVAVEK
jgi:hypothetical protein